MNKVIGVTELQRNFRRIFDEVARNRTPYILTRDSRPEVVMIPYEEFVRLQESHEAQLEARMARLLAKMDRLNRSFADEEVDMDLREADKEI